MPYTTTHSYCAPALACATYALGRLRFRPPRNWTAALLASMRRQMAALGAQELATVVWALAVLGVRPDAEWLHSFQKQVQPALTASRISALCAA